MKGSTLVRCLPVASLPHVAWRDVTKWGWNLHPWRLVLPKMIFFNVCPYYLLTHLFGDFFLGYLISKSILGVSKDIYSMVLKGVLLETSKNGPVGENLPNNTPRSNNSSQSYIVVECPVFLCFLWQGRP